MRRKSALLIIAVILAQFGCARVHDARRTLAWEIAQHTDDRLELYRNHCLAAAQWNEMQAGSGGALSEDYGCGFRDGFVDYLRAGGTGEPPALPPQRYWRVEYQTPEGNQAIRDWFAGFRQGARAAMEHGHRQWITVPSSVTLCSPAAVQESCCGQAATSATRRAETALLWPPQPETEAHDEELADVILQALDVDTAGSDPADSEEFQPIILVQDDCEVSTEAVPAAASTLPPTQN